MTRSLRAAEPDEPGAIRLWDYLIAGDRRHGVPDGTMAEETLTFGAVAARLEETGTAADYAAALGIPLADAEMRLQRFVAAVGVRPDTIEDIQANQAGKLGPGGSLLNRVWVKTVIVPERAA